VFLPTFARLAETETATRRRIDGKDIWSLMAGVKGAKSPHDAFYYYFVDQLQAVRSGKWKLHLALEAKQSGWNRDEAPSEMRLYNLNKDIGETTDVSGKHPEVVARLLELAGRARATVGDGNRRGTHQRPVGRVANPRPLELVVTQHGV